MRNQIRKIGDRVWVYRYTVVPPFGGVIVASQDSKRGPYDIKEDNIPHYTHDDLVHTYVDERELFTDALTAWLAYRGWLQDLIIRRKNWLTLAEEIMHDATVKIRNLERGGK